MTTGDGLYWLGVFAAVGALFFVAAYEAGMALYAIATLTFFLARWATK